MAADTPTGAASVDSAAGTDTLLVDLCDAMTGHGWFDPDHFSPSQLREHAASLASEARAEILQLRAERDGLAAHLAGLEALLTQVAETQMAIAADDAHPATDPERQRLTEAAEDALYGVLAWHAVMLDAARATPGGEVARG